MSNGKNERKQCRCSISMRNYPISLDKVYTNFKTYSRLYLIDVRATAR